MKNLENPRVPGGLEVLKVQEVLEVQVVLYGPFDIFSPNEFTILFIIFE
jgi:hypothetical protein